MAPNTRASQITAVSSGMARPPETLKRQGQKQAREHPHPRQHPPTHQGLQRPAAQAVPKPGVRGGGG